MRDLADAIVLEVGWAHWYRMNVVRLSQRGALIDFVYPDDFIEDIKARVGADRVISYLIERLTPERLALPDGYIVGSRQA